MAERFFILNYLFDHFVYPFALTRSSKHGWLCTRPLNEPIIFMLDFLVCGQLQPVLKEWAINHQGMKFSVFTTHVHSDSLEFGDNRLSNSLTEEILPHSRVAGNNYCFDSRSQHIINQFNPVQ